MTKERSLTKLELVRATVSGRKGWVEASWERADGSTGDAIARFRKKKAERWYIAQLLVTLPTTARLRDVPLARIEDAANADPGIRKWIEDATDPETLKRAHTAAAKRPKLARSKSRRLDDDFFKLVADAYRGAVANGLQPAKTLADESDSPQGTVNRWIAEARRRGYLPAGQQGRVTA
jgi:hypothetical protein